MGQEEMKNNQGTERSDLSEKIKWAKYVWADLMLTKCNIIVI